MIYMTLETLFTVVCVIGCIVCFVAYQLTCEKQYFTYVDQKVGK